MTDRVVYESGNKPVYVIQFETENGVWADAGGTHYRSAESALRELNTRPVAPYPYRIVERTK